jgi:hypothetical protein
MRQDFPHVEWNAATGRLELALGLENDPHFDKYRFSARACIQFSPIGQVCSVDVRDLPAEISFVEPAGTAVAGQPYLDCGWLWIPLAETKGRNYVSGRATVELRLDRTRITRLSLQFEVMEMASQFSLS